jgi:thiamine biosynthesis lipoprotein
MKSPSSIEIRRCRPLLGTFVEITVSLCPPDRTWPIAAECAALQTFRECGLRAPTREAFGVRRIPSLSEGSTFGRMSTLGQSRSVGTAGDVVRDEMSLQNAVNAAFVAIERIQSLMSVHDPASELSLVNREAAKRPVTVSRELFTVLRRAHRLARQSAGAFDYTVAPLLARWGLRPSWLKRRRAGNWRHVSLLQGRRVRFLRPLALDLGGIAKGYAVDVAIKTLQRHGVKSAIVNAGGDLRVFGRPSVAIHLRHPSSPRLLSGRLDISDAALATSSPCFTLSRQHGRRISHLVNSHARNAITNRISVSVRAPDCWLADALTKVVLNAPPTVAKTLLARHSAEAIILSGVTERGCGGWRGPAAADCK